MDKNRALSAFAALSQPTRLDVFRLLMQAGPEGMAAGDIASALNVRQNTMSANLSILHQAGLITSARDGRRVRYAADLAGVRGLLGFLVQDCCGGHPDQCQPLIAELTQTC